nr:PAS domain-containing protein [uncultured Rhodopila sp.]
METEFCFVDALPGLVWSALDDGHFDFVNQRWCEYTGLGVNESLGRGWRDAVHPADMAGLSERWRAVPAPHETEARLRRFDGAYRWFLFRTSPLRGKSSRWCGIATDIEDRKQAEAAVRAREGRFRSIVDEIPALITLMTPDGELEFVNRQVVDYFGAPLEELQSWPLGDTFHPDDRAAVRAAWRRSVETGQRFDVEGRRRRADGVYRWFQVRGFPLRDAGGRILVWYLLHTDIDDRKRTEALLAGEKRLLEMVTGGDSMPAILEALCRLVESTAAGCYCSVVLVDQAGARLEHGAAPSLPASFINSIIGRPVAADSGPCAMAAYLNEQVVSTDLTSEPRWRSHGWRPMAMRHGLRSCWSTPIVSRSGKVLGAFAIYYDQPGQPAPIHQRVVEQFKHIASIAIERTQNDAALKRSEAFLAETRRITSTGGFTKRVASGEILWSEEVYRIFEFDPAVPVTLEQIRSRVHPDDLPSFQHMLDRQQRGSDYEHDYRLLMPDRSVKYLHVVAHATRDRDGELVYIAAVQDVTQRRLSEEALARTRSELARVARVSSLGALTASIAHEVNQPLSGIITNASTCLRMLAADPPNVDGARETARRTIRDGNRASDVITRLRALFSKQDTAAEAVDLNEAARKVIALSLSEIQRSRAVLREEFADGLPPVTGDRVQLQQVILNLLLNALDAMSGAESRQLTVSTERCENDHVRLSVRDSGAGFDPQHAERLFEAFYTTKSGGMGIGLSVSRSIIESHRGRLWAVPNDGPGATFSFSVPQRLDKDARAVWTSAVKDPQHVSRVS